MPYISQEEREFLTNGNAPVTDGQVNYLVTLLMYSYFDNYYTANEIAACIEEAIADLRNEGVYHSSSDSCFSKDLERIVNNANISPRDTIGALRNAHLEFYIRRIRPYEDKKIEQNGDVTVKG